MAIEDRVGYLSRDQFVSDITGTVGTSLSGTFQPLNATLTTLSSRVIGVASPTDIIDRASGDSRYQPLRSACMVRKSADMIGQNFTTAVALSWDTEIYDDSSWHDTVTNPSRFTVPSGVTRVRVGGAVKIVNGTAADRARIRLMKNGTNVFNGTCSADIQEQGPQVALSISSGPIVCVAGDYFELQVFIGTDTSVDITAAETNFWIESV